MSSRAAASCPFMVAVVVEHWPVSLALFLSPVAWLMEATGVRGFPVAVLRLTLLPQATSLLGTLLGFAL